VPNNQVDDKKYLLRYKQPALCTQPRGHGRSEPQRRTNPLGRVRLNHGQTGESTPSDDKAPSPLRPQGTPSPWGVEVLRVDLVQKFAEFLYLFFGRFGGRHARLAQDLFGGQYRRPHPKGNGNGV